MATEQSTVREFFFRKLRSLCPVGLNQPSITESEFLDRSRKIDANLVLQQQCAQDFVIYRRDVKKKETKVEAHVTL